MKTISKLICLLFLPGALAAADTEFLDPHVRLVPEGMKNTAGYVTVRNNSGQDRKITKASCTRAAACELHEHIDDGGVMRMRPVDSVRIQAGGQTEFKPGGYHIMLIGLSSAIKEGETIPIVLTLDDNTSTTVNFTVRRMAEDGMDHSAHGNHGNGHANHSGHAGHNHNVADMLPPAGVMGAHMHEPGKWLLDYRLMVMGMNKVMDRSQTQSPEMVLYGIYQNPRVQMSMTGLAPPSPFLPAARVEQNQFRYMSVGRTMSMEMHMLSAMYQYSENTMLMFMVPYVKNRMEMIANNFETANMSSKGVGDVSLSALFRVLSKGDHTFFLGTGLALPTGSIDEKDWMPQMGRSPVAYAMQPGAGTPSVLLQSAYTGRWSILSWGAQLDGMLRSGKNDNNYRAGNRYSATGWGAVRAADWISFSVRVQKSRWENYKGQDPSLDPAMDPGNDPMLQGGQRVDVLGGINLVITGGSLAGVRFFLEGGQPVSQHLNGPQMATTFVGNAGVQVPL
jgi:copper(I)-binding protein